MSVIRRMSGNDDEYPPDEWFWQGEVASFQTSECRMKHGVSIA